MHRFLLFGLTKDNDILKEGMVMMRKTGKTLLILFIFTFFISLFLPESTIIAEERFIEADIKLDEDAEIIESEFTKIQLKRLKKEEPTYTLDIELPFFMDKKLDSTVRKHIKHLIEEFFAISKGNVSKERRGNLTVKANVYLSGKDLYSVVLHEEIYSGGANANQQAKVWLADLKDDRFVVQETIFNDPEEAKEIIRPLVKEALLNSEQYKDYILEDELEKWMEKEEYHFENMFIRDGHLVFIFNKYEVVAGAAGMPEIEIPISEVEHLINPDWYKRIDHAL